MNIRYTYSDIARRYIKIHGGHIEYDYGYGGLDDKMYLYDKDKECIAIVQYGDFFIKKHIKHNETDIIGDIPY